MIQIENLYIMVSEYWKSVTLMGVEKLESAANLSKLVEVYEDNVLKLIPFPGNHRSKDMLLEKKSFSLYDIPQLNK